MTHEANPFTLFPDQQGDIGQVDFSLVDRAIERNFDASLIPVQKARIRKEAATGFSVLARVGAASALSTINETNLQGRGSIHHVVDMIPDYVIIGEDTAHIQCVDFETVTTSELVYQAGYVNDRLLFGHLLVGMLANGNFGIYADQNHNESLHQYVPDRVKLYETLSKRSLLRTTRTFAGETLLHVPVIGEDGIVDGTEKMFGVISGIMLAALQAKTLPAHQAYQA